MSRPILSEEKMFLLLKCTKEVLRQIFKLGINNIKLMLGSPSFCVDKKEITSKQVLEFHFKTITFKAKEINY